MDALDAITLGVADLPSAQAFYLPVLEPIEDDRGSTVDFDLHGTGHLVLRGAGPLAVDAGVASPATSGFRGFVVSYIVKQPREVQAVTAAAAEGGATVLKAPKKGFFGGFSAVWQAPDGTVWKVSCELKKDKGMATIPAVPSETAALLGVADPKASKAFYEALGFTTDRDYGSKYIDFTPAPGTSRLGLMPRGALAKDAGLTDDGEGFRALVLGRRAGSHEEVDTLLASAEKAGGTVVVPAAETRSGRYVGVFEDPDGYAWRVVAE